MSDARRPDEGAPNEGKPLGPIRRGNPEEAPLPDKEWVENVEVEYD